MRLPITVIVLTYNEEINLPHCLESIKDWVSDIIVVDSGSTDKTRDVAKQYGARVEERAFKNQAEQFNWAIDTLPIRTEWILRLDADERMTEKVWAELAGLLPQATSEVGGFLMKRRVYFMGRWIRHGGYYPTWFLRLIRRGAARYEEREVDEHMTLLRGRVQKLEHDFIDQNLKDLSWWIKKQNNYSTREAAERLKGAGGKRLVKIQGQAGRKRTFKNLYLKLPLFWRSFFYFKYRYIFRLGFLDGKEGLIFHFLQGCWHQFLIDAKIYESQEKKHEK